MHEFVIIVTGLSGSGKTTALKTLEDFGCEVIDNIPISLCPLLIEEKQMRAPLALGIDVRTRDFNAPSFLTHLQQFRARSTLKTILLFFEADPSAIETRYRESRRQHPLGITDPIPFLIQKEQELLASIRCQADDIINTTCFSPPEMKSYLQNALNFRPFSKPKIYLLSFSYRRGVPYNADFVFDMRFLPNPYYQKNMKFLTGKSPEVLFYLQQEPKFQKFMNLFGQITAQLAFTEKRPSFVIGFGCTGGRHRSVLTAEAASHLLEEQGYPCQIYHRDLT